MQGDISVSNLTKRYGDVQAVNGIDFQVNAGEVFGLLGPNGAGKTTIVEILEGLRDRTDGEVTVMGYDPARKAASCATKSVSPCSPPTSRRRSR